MAKKQKTDLVHLTSASGEAVSSVPKFTPGPWRWWTSNSFRRLSSDATGKDGDVLYACVCPDRVADVVLPNGGAEGPDAHLIAAAPELYEALRPFAAFLDALEHMGGTFPKSGPLYELVSHIGGTRTLTVEDFAAARAALSSAEGKQ